MTNEYFEKYSSRKVNFRNCSGLFSFNGSPLDRGKLPNLKITQDLSDNNLSANECNISLKTSNCKLIRKSHCKHSETSCLESVVEPKKTTEYYSRFAIPAYETVTVHHNAIKEAKKNLYIKVYHETNKPNTDFRGELLNVADRLWLPAYQQTELLKQTLANEVIGGKRANASLGLSPLRMNGTGQDKAHHMSKQRDLRRPIIYGGADCSNINNS